MNPYPDFLYKIELSILQNYSEAKRKKVMYTNNAGGMFLNGHKTSFLHRMKEKPHFFIFSFFSYLAAFVLFCGTKMEHVVWLFLFKKCVAILCTSTLFIFMLFV